MSAEQPNTVARGASKGLDISNSANVPETVVFPADSARRPVRGGHVVENHGQDSKA